MISREVDPSVEQLFNPISVLVPTHPSFTFYPATGGMSLKPVDPFKIYPGRRFLCKVYFERILLRNVLRSLLFIIF